MRLHELQLTKDLIAAKEPVPGEGFQPGAQVKDVFTKHNWPLLGHGLEGAVGQHPTKDMVAKIFVKDSLYKEFVNIVKDNPNPHFPKFLKYVRDIPNTIFSYILMEKLEATNPDFLVDNYIPELYVLDTESESFLGKGIQGKFGAYVLDYIYDVQEEHRDNPYNPRVWNELGQKPDDAWFKACKMISHVAKLIGLRHLDLGNPKNFMLRGNTLVIIDPFAAATAE
jgi:hypothetical protein